MKIVCEHISKTFKVNNYEFKALDDINIETEERDFVCILGPNGCGKTTLIRIVAGTVMPSCGKVHYVGNSDYPVAASLIFQEQYLFPWLSVIDNVCFYLEMKGLSKKERYKKAQYFIDRMGLNKFVNYYPHQLSTGMKQKVNLTRGLLVDSAILLIDEVEKSLDIYTKLLIQRDIYNIWEEHHKTIVYITHDVDEAIHLARHIWVMSRSPGKIIKKFDVSLYKAGVERGKIDIRLLELKDEIIDIIQAQAQGG